MGKAVAADACQQIKTALKSGPVILLPTHRSHMDYVRLWIPYVISWFIAHFTQYAQIAIQFAAVANQLPVPFVIAGIWRLSLEQFAFVTMVAKVTT